MNCVVPNAANITAGSRFRSCCDTPFGAVTYNTTQKKTSLLFRTEWESRTWPDILPVKNVFFRNQEASVEDRLAKKKSNEALQWDAYRTWPPHLHDIAPPNSCRAIFTAPEHGGDGVPCQSSLQLSCYVPKIIRPRTPAHKGILFALEKQNSFNETQKRTQ